MDIRNLSLPKRLLAGLGCVTVLVLLVAVALLFHLDRKAANRARQDLAQAAPGWMDSLRATGRLPDLTGLVSPSTDATDGAWAVYDTTLSISRVGVDHAYRALTGTDTATAADSALWVELAADTTLDRWAAAAGASRWDATTRVLATHPAGSVPNILLLPAPDYFRVRNAVRALVIRGIMRLQRRDQDGARADFAAATGIGLRMARREPTYLGFLMGRVAIASGLAGWQRYAAATRDTALAARVTRLQPWAQTRPVSAGPLMAAPDSALVIAADTGLALGVRTLGLEQALAAWVVRPRALVFGPPRRSLRALDAFAADPDPDMAAMARLFAGTAHRLNLFRVWGLVRETP